jgi:hypothetical protein
MIAEIRKPEPARQAQPAHVPRLVTLEELAQQWALPITWLRESCRTRCADPLPIFRMGRYVRVDLADPELELWLSRRRSQARSR